jgi:hypothetical protein
MGEFMSAGHCAPPAPLCPAGHLPHRWGDRLGAAARPELIVWGESNHLPISPLEGEMPGRAEGGNPRHQLCEVAS